MKFHILYITYLANYCIINIKYSENLKNKPKAWNFNFNTYPTLPFDFNITK